MSSRKLIPTHTEITTFLESFLPPSLNAETQAREVPFLYHTVRGSRYSPLSQLTSRVVFSVTPTRGVYSALDSLNPRGLLPICFLHRPFNLNRRAVRHGALVLSSHKSFDEHLTVGWNSALGARLGLDLGSAICVQGYKGDDERKIGLVARLQQSSSLGELTTLLRAEFRESGELFTSQPALTETSDAGVCADDHADLEQSYVGSGTPINVIAIMNAFHAEEVQRVLIAAHAAGWISDVNKGDQVLYLTGAARPYGVEAVAKVGMPAYCVGHVACEEWGIRYLAQQTRDRWPALDVQEVFEEEEPRPARKTVKTKEEESDGTHLTT